MAIRKHKKDRTGLTISIVAHAVVIGAVLFWLTGTKGGREFGRKLIEAIRPPEPSKEPPKQKPEPKAPPKQLPTINDDPGSKSTGTRRTSSVDAPAAAGDSFFVDTREQVGGTGRGGAGEKKEDKKAAPIVITRPPPRVELRPPPATGAGSTAKLLTERQKSIAAKDSIGAEAIDRTTGSDVGDVLTKVTGASIVDGKFAVVRGLSDRYTLTTLNGADVPTPDPYRKSVQLDIFPAKTVESVTVTKTFTPDLPGSWAGGLIDIKTKSFPEKFTFSVSVGLGYNTQSSLRDDFLSDGGESGDVFAKGSGARALPDILVPEGSLPDPNAFANAGLREPPEKTIERRRQADQLAAMTRAFKSTTLAPVQTDSFLNQNHVISIGDTVRMFQRPLGYFAGFSYRSDYSAYDDGLSERFTETQKKRTLFESKATHEISWSGVATLAYKLNPQHDLAFNFVYNQSAENTARSAVGTNLTTGPGGEALLNLNTLSYTERNLTTYQLRGGHDFPDIGNVRLDWLGALSETSQKEPDLRFFNQYTRPLPGGGTENLVGDNSLLAPYRPTRYFRTIDENNKNVKADLTIPFRQWADLEGLLKGGVYESKTEREFRERTFTYNAFLNPNVAPEAQDPWRTNGTPNTFLDDRYLGYTTEVPPRRRNTNYYFLRYLTSELGNAQYDGNVTIPAAYGMIEIPVVEKVRLVGGARLEKTDLEVVAQPSNAIEPIGSTIKQVDVLPAAGLIWSIRSNMNVRLNWSQTLARPTFREIAPVRVYDIYDDVVYTGNPALRITGSENFDIRWEWFPRLGEVLSISLFYKDLTDPIEKYSEDIEGDFITFTNRPTGKVFGVEFEARKSLDFIDRNLAGFSLGANVSLIYSETPLFDDEFINKSRTDPEVERDRPLYDQSPYIINLDLTYNNPSWGTTITVSANLAGERIYFAHPSTQDIYDHPPTSLDLVISQRLSRYWKVKFGAKNLLDSPVLRTLGPEADGPVYTKYTRGMTFGMSLSADF